MADFNTDDNAYNEVVRRTAAQEKMGQEQLRQRMTDFGIASQPLTIQSQNDQANLTNMGDIQRQREGQQEFNQALQRQAGLGLGAQEQTIQGQQDFATSQLDQAKQNRNIDIYYRLFQSNKMTARQFERLTGIPVKAYSASVNTTDDPFGDFFGRNIANPDEKAAIATFRGFENTPEGPTDSEQSAISLINSFDRE
jgi:hypothetical protein